MYKILLGFEIQTNPPIQAKRPELALISKKKRICHIVDFAMLTKHRVKGKESEKLDKYQDLARELWNKKVALMPVVMGALGSSPNVCLIIIIIIIIINSIIENGQNTEKSPRDLRRLAVTQSPVKDHQLTLM